MILIFDYFETIVHNKSMDFNRGLKVMWENITKINVPLRKYLFMGNNFQWMIANKIIQNICGAAVYIKYNNIES